MMEGQGFDNRIRQAPEPQQIGPDLSVRGSQQSALRFPHRSAGYLCLCEGGTVEIRQVRSEDQLTNVVQQAGHERMIDHMPIRLRFLGNTFGTDTRSQAVLPEDIERKCPFLLVVEVRANLNGEDQRFDRIMTE